MFDAIMIQLGHNGPLLFLLSLATLVVFVWVLSRLVRALQAARHLVAVLHGAPKPRALQPLLLVDLQPCPTCKGLAGDALRSAREACPHCRGRGVLLASRN